MLHGRDLLSAIAQNAGTRRARRRGSRSACGLDCVGDRLRHAGLAEGRGETSAQIVNRMSVSSSGRRLKCAGDRGKSDNLLSRSAGLGRRDRSSAGPPLRWRPARISLASGADAGDAARDSSSSGRAATICSAKSTCAQSSEAASPRRQGTAIMKRTKSRQTGGRKLAARHNVAHSASDRQFAREAGGRGRRAFEIAAQGLPPTKPSSCSPIEEPPQGAKAVPGRVRALGIGGEQAAHIDRGDVLDRLVARRPSPRPRRGHARFPPPRMTEK